MKFRYEDLNVVTQIQDFIISVYTLTKKFPETERYGLTSQARRSATSVLLNVAEGSARHSYRDFARFIKIAQGSLVETDATLKIAQKLRYISENDRGELDELTEGIYYKLHHLRNSQLSK